MNVTDGVYVEKPIYNYLFPKVYLQSHWLIKPLPSPSPISSNN